MKLKALGVFVALIAVAFISVVAWATETPVVDSFVEALTNKDRAKQAEIIANNKDTIPAEVKILLTDAMKDGISVEDQEAKLFAAEIITTLYKDKYGDAEPLKAVRRASFESKLTKPVVSAAVDGKHAVKFPIGGEGEARKDRFEPNNIIIKEGDTVKWTNDDKIPHLFATMPFIGEGGIFSPSIKPGESWEYTFKKAGDYYLICFIHKGMVSKIRVEGEVKKEEVPPAAAPAAIPAVEEKKPDAATTGEKPAEKPLKSKKKKKTDTKTDSTKTDNTKTDTKK